MRRAVLYSSAACVVAAALAACGGAGGASSATPPIGGSGMSTATPSASPSPSASGYAVSGTVMRIPSDAYGPTSVDGASYASADANQSTPLAGATVVVGPVPIVGATAPAVLPTGDIRMTTTASGVFSGSVAVAPTAASTQEPFVVPTLNLSGATIPSAGYYVEVFGAGSDGLSANVAIPMHRFMTMQGAATLRVSTPSSAEAAALAQVNADRRTYANVGPLIFDESAEEVARMHASDEAANGYYCHYDLHNAGPASRYLASAGLGMTVENLAAPVASNIGAGFQDSETAFLAERNASPQGGHYLDLVDPTHSWAGLAAEMFVGGSQVDYELVSATALDTTFAAAGYETGPGCPTSISTNNS